MSQACPTLRARSCVRFFLTSLLLSLAISVAQAVPVVDPAFGTQGVTRIGVPSGFYDSANASLMQPDGKVVVAGNSSGRQNYALVARFTSAGTLDSAFGSGGIVLLSQPVSIEPATVDLLPDGRLLIVSRRPDIGYVLTRLTAQGGVDASFGDNGSVAVSEPGLFATVSVVRPTLFPVRVAIQPDGRMLVVNDASANGVFALRFRRFMPDGTLDASFGTGGVRLLDKLPANFQFRSSRVAVAEPTGGFTIVADGAPGGPTYLMFRVTSDGALDRSFAGIGHVSAVQISNSADFPTMLARGGDGRYVLFGYTLTRLGVPDRHDVLWKIEASGSPSPFGTGNQVATGSTDDAAGAMTTLPDGAIAIVHTVDRSTIRFAVFEANGSPRAGFGAGGSATLAVAGYASAIPVGLHADAAGRLIMSGRAYERLASFGLAFVPRGYDALLVSVSASGVPRTDLGRGDGTAVWNNPALSNDRIDVLDVDRSGRILVAGVSDPEPAGQALSTTQLLSRLTANGTPDASYGDSGRVNPGFNAQRAGIIRVARQPDDAIIIATGSSFGSSGNFRAVDFLRFNAVGARDTTFHAEAAPAGGSGTVGLAVRPDGRIVYATRDGPAAGGAAGPYVLQQFLPDGSADLAFGTNGRAVFPADQEARVLSDLALLGDGSVAFAMFAGSKVSLFKVDAMGRPVTSFGTSGRAISDGVDITYTDYAINNARLLALADGTLMTISAVFASPLPNPIRRFVQIVRFSPSGAVISTRRLSIGASDNVVASVASVVLPDASVIIARNISPSVATLARLLPDDRFDPAFGGENGAPVAFTAISALAFDAAGRLIVGGQDSTSALVARYRFDSNESSVGAVEYFNVNLGHYFVSADAGEQASIAAGAAGPGWQRTGNSFNVWFADAGIPPGALPVCRFYGTPGRGPNSHFYTVSASECAGVRQDPGWTYEGVAFYMFAAADGQCAAGQQPVYRAYNNRFAENDSNHRYSTQLADLQALAAQGWSIEGVAFCSPAG